MDPRDSPNTRVLYFGALGAVALILVLVRFVFVPNRAGQSTFQATCGTVIDGLLAATLASVFVGLGYVLVLSRRERVHIDYLPSKQIKGELEQAARVATHWKVKARTASYFVRYTLPLLAANSSASIKIELLDPESDSMLQNYMGFRSSHPGSDGWNLDKIRREIYGSILVIALYNNRYARLDFDVRLSLSFWMLSFDCAPSAIFICGQNKGDSAISLPQHSEFYRHFDDDFDASFASARRISPAIENFTLEDLPRPLTPAARNAIRQMFMDLGLSRTEDDEIEAVVQLAQRRHHLA